MSAKLTKSQKTFLGDCFERPQRVVVGYKPAEKLKALGLIVIADRNLVDGWYCTITAAGSAWIKAHW